MYKMTSKRRVKYYF